VTGHSYIFDVPVIRALVFGAFCGGLWLVARMLIEWLVAPGLRRIGLAASEPYDWPRWVWRARLACRAYLGLNPRPLRRIAPMRPAPRRIHSNCR
jgi:hypothetical protein